MATTWRKFFRPVIQTVILENKGRGWQASRRALRDAKPPDARTFSSVNAVWLDECKKQLAAAGLENPRRPANIAAPPYCSPPSGCFICEDERQAGRWTPGKDCLTCSLPDIAQPTPRPAIGEQMTLF